MYLHIKGVHYEVSDKTQHFISDKISHIDPFKELLVSVEITIAKEKTEYRVESNVHFRWGINVHISESDINLHTAIDKLIHKLDSKITKEKEKVKDHHRKNNEANIE